MRMVMIGLVLGLALIALGSPATPTEADEGLNITVSVEVPNGGGIRVIDTIFDITLNPVSGFLEIRTNGALISGVPGTLIVLVPDDGGICNPNVGC